MLRTTKYNINSVDFEFYTFSFTIDKIAFVHKHSNRFPDVVGFQAEEHLAEGEGYLNGDPDECSVPVGF